MKRCRLPSMFMASVLMLHFAAPMARPNAAASRGPTFEPCMGPYISASLDHRTGPFSWYQQFQDIDVAETSTSEQTASKNTADSASAPIATPHDTASDDTASLDGTSPETAVGMAPSPSDSLARLLADARHSSGCQLAMRLNEENEGLTTASTPLPAQLATAARPVSEHIDAPIAGPLCDHPDFRCPLFDAPQWLDDEPTPDDPAGREAPPVDAPPIDAPPVTAATASTIDAPMADPSALEIGAAWRWVTQGAVDSAASLAAAWCDRLGRRMLSISRVLQEMATSDSPEKNALEGIGTTHEPADAPFRAALVGRGFAM